MASLDCITPGEKESHRIALTSEDVTRNSGISKGVLSAVTLLWNIIWSIIQGPIDNSGFERGISIATALRSVILSVENFKVQGSFEPQ